MEDDKRVQPEGHLVYCECIDMIGSTKMGFNLSTRQLDRFNLSLIEQIKPHLEKLDLTDTILKFTGDGWLVMSKGEKSVPALCCLATIMAYGFQDEMSLKTSIYRNAIPSLRVSICSGRDICVELPDGRKDWVGDSARRAVRAAQWCEPNVIVIDEPVRYCIWRDFGIKNLNQKKDSCEQVVKHEEDFSLHVLGELKVEAIAGSEVPGCFVYTLDTIGRTKEAKTVAQEASEHLKTKTKKNLEKEQREAILRSWNRLLASISDYLFVLEIFKKIQSTGLVPNVVTYNTLIGKSTDYEEAKGGLAIMQ